MNSFPGGSVVKSSPANAGDVVGSVGGEDPTATSSTNLAWGIPWTKEPGGLQSRGSQGVGYDFVNKQQQLRMKSLCREGLQVLGGL